MEREPDGSLLDAESATWVRTNLDPVLDRLAVQLLASQPETPLTFLRDVLEQDLRAKEAAALRQELEQLMDEVAHLEAGVGTTAGHCASASSSALAARKRLNDDSDGMPCDEEAFEKIPISKMTTEKEYNITLLPFKSHVKVFNMDLSGAQPDELRRYLRLSTDHAELQVTTSCFSAWMKSKRTNGFAKVIPAVPQDNLESGDCRIFFFDDNMEWEGLETSGGICNLRHLATGKFVDFGEDTNGFTRHVHFKHTIVHSSSHYRNVLVKASILDAIQHPDYFTSIFNAFSEPGQTLIAYMDVNSTIVCVDTAQGKTVEATLRSLQFECIEATPREPFELLWEGHRPLRVEKPKTLKQLVKEIQAGSSMDLGSLHTFWNEESCNSIFEQLASKAQLTWTHTGLPVTLQEYQNDLRESMACVARATNADGLVESWFNAYNFLRRGQHKIVLNSFGVDSRKVVQATVQDESYVLEVAINFEKWSDRDALAFRKLFEG